MTYIEGQEVEIWGANMYPWRGANMYPWRKAKIVHLAGEWRCCGGGNHYEVEFPNGMRAVFAENHIRPVAPAAVESASGKSQHD